MRRIVSIEQHGDAESVLELDHDMRNRRRAVYRPATGAPLLLDMERVVHLRGGDRLLLDDGSRVAIAAAAEPLIEITAPDLHALVRIAWHLGNRHLPTQLADGHLLIRHDHVIAEMVEGLGGACRAILAPFDPEGGAYAGGGAAPHDHGHSHSHDHDHGHHHHDH
jgi:urease accessory protein